MYADPVSGQPLGRQPNRAHLSLAERLAERIKTVVSSPGTAVGAEEVRRIETEVRAARAVPGAGGRVRPDLFS